MSSVPLLSLPNCGTVTPRQSNLRSGLPFSNLNRTLISPTSLPHRFQPLRAASTNQPPPHSTPPPPPTTTITIQNDAASPSTAIVIRARNRIGLLQVITRVFKLLGLRIEKAAVEFEVEDECFVKKFLVSDSGGNKIEDRESLDRIEKALVDAIGTGNGGTLTAGDSGRGIVARRAGLVGREGSGKAERMFELMDGFLKNDPLSLQKDILYHVEYTVARSRFNFDDFEAYQVHIAL